MARTAPVGAVELHALGGKALGQGVQVLLGGGVGTARKEKRDEKDLHGLPPAGQRIIPLTEVKKTRILPRIPMFSWSSLKKPIIALSPMADMTDSAFCRVAKRL